MKRFSFGAGLIALMFSVLLVSSVWAAEPIKIGVIGPMAFTQGQGHWNGATMALEEINAKGGIMVGGAKRLLELVKVDS
ncbi:MAG: ethanolamine utilization protein EutN, partial [Pseudomonadota bacterium]